jgi:membrane dipeptidase
MTLTHNVTLDWADAALDSAKHGGLTRFGEEVVHEMNRLGMLVDLSHVSPGTMSDALDVTEAPVIFSHSSARALTDIPRNVPDSILRRMPANGGVVMVTFVPTFVSPDALGWSRRRDSTFAALRKDRGADSGSFVRDTTAWSSSNPAPRATLGQVAEIDHVGIGGDFDGITEVVLGLEDVSKYPALFAELAHRGWSEANLRKLAGENLLRAFGQAEAVSAKLRKARPASNATIEMLDWKR